MRSVVVTAPKRAIGLMAAVTLWVFAGAVTPAGADPVASGSGERLVFTLPPGWAPLHTVDTAVYQRTFFVPESQNAAVWTDMIAVSMTRGPDRRDLRATHAATAAEYEKHCAGPTITAPQSGNSVGLSRGFWTMGCPLRRETGQGEVSFVLFLQGREGAYLVQRVWRTAPFENREPPLPPGERDAAITFLQSVTLEGVR